MNDIKKQANKGDKSNPPTGGMSLLIGASIGSDTTTTRLKKGL